MDKVITFKTDTKTKKAAQALAREAGLTMSSLINSSLKQVIRERRLDIRLSEEMSPKLEKLLEPIDKDIKAGKNLSRAHSSATSFLKDLHSNEDQIS